MIYQPKIDEFIDPFGRYKGYWPYRAGNHTENMVDAINKINIY